MKRVNYARGTFEGTVGAPLAAVLAPALRAPLFALGATLAATGMLWGVQQARLEAVMRASDAYAVRLAALEPSGERVRAAQRELARLRAMNRTLDDVTASGARSASAIAALGNALPEGAWLTALRADRGTLALDGRGARLTAVADAISALDALGTYGAVRLTSARADALRSGVIYGLTLQVAR